MNLLIVDDEQIHLDNLEIGLKRHGYKIHKALNGQQALGVLQAPKAGDAEIDIVIMDYAMPGMNGIELLKEIRRLDRNLPVIMMTAYGDKSLIVRAMRHRCDSYIDKPFTLDRLIREIDLAKINMIRNTGTSDLEAKTRKLIHQINNPLMSIAGFAELSMEHMDDLDQLQVNIRAIMKAAQKIDRINQEILATAKNQSRPTRSRVDALAVLQSSLDAFDGLMRLKEVSLETDFNDRPFHVRADRFNLEQLFNNLILNAVDAMDGMQEKRLFVRVRAGDQGKGRIDISDTGAGIPDNTIHKIFDTYVTTKPSGTGLGLSVVKDVVCAMDGRISVESVEGRGACFSLVLPLAASLEEPSGITA